MKFKLSKQGQNFKKTAIALNWRQINEQIAQKFDEQMNLAVYSWPRETVTKSGNPAIKGSPRKITDTRELQDSRTLTFSDDGLTAIHRWDADHAAQVLVGGTNKNGTYNPPRDWITPVLIEQFL